MKNTESQKNTAFPGRGLRNHPGLSERDGFTLLEVVVALGILATALVILLESHYGSLRLFDSAQEVAFMDNLLLHALGESEREVLAGNLSGEGDFGRRYPDYSFSFSAQEANVEDLPGLFEITVTVQGASTELEVIHLTFDGNQLET